MRFFNAKLNLPLLAVTGGILGAAVTAPARAQVLDQEQSEHPYSFNGDATWARWQQGITVGLAGPLAGIEIYVYEEGGNPPGTAEVYVNAGPPWQYDTHDFETICSPSQEGWVYIDTSAAGLNFDVGDQFVIGVQGIGGGFWFGGSSPGPGGPYDRGELWSEESVYQGGQYDMAFRTWVGTAGPDGDVDGDGDVDLNDLAALLSAYGACTGDPSYNPDADFDDSGCVDLSDLATLLSNYGTGT